MARLPGLGQRFGSAALVVPALIVFAGAPAQAIVRTSISVDGDVSDWGVVLRDARNIAPDESLAGGDPDKPGTSDRDIRMLGVTGDSDNAYFDVRRTTTGSSRPHVLLYIDLHNDGDLDDGSHILLDAKFNGSAFRGEEGFRYDAVAVADPVTGDGVTEPGRARRRSRPTSSEPAPAPASSTR